VGFVWRAAERGGRDPARAAMLVGLNPALLVHVVGGAHNEAIVLLALSGVVLVFAGGRPAASAALAVGACAVKASAAVVVPFLVAGAGRRPADPRSRTGRRRPVARAALAAGAAALAAIGVGIAGFGAETLGWLEAVRENQARTSSFSLPSKAAELLAAVLPGDLIDFRTGVRLVYAIVFGVVLAWLLRRTWREDDPLAMAGWATVALLVCSAWLVPWYIAWLLPFAAVSASRRLAGATVVLTAWTLAIAIPF
jgi:hypothetical protein